MRVPHDVVKEEEVQVPNVKALTPAGHHVASTQGACTRLVGREGDCIRDDAAEKCHALSRFIHSKLAKGWLSWHEIYEEEKLLWAVPCSIGPRNRCQASGWKLHKTQAV